MAKCSVENFLEDSKLQDYSIGSAIIGITVKFFTLVGKKAHNLLGISIVITFYEESLSYKTSQARQSTSNATFFLENFSKIKTQDLFFMETQILLKSVGLMLKIYFYVLV